jgi:hypothetical protein
VSPRWAPTGERGGVMGRPDHGHERAWNRFAVPYLRHGSMIRAAFTQRHHHMNMTSTAGVPAVLSGTTADLERELFHIAVRGLAEGTGFYQHTDERFIALADHLALADDGWLVRFIGWPTPRGTSTTRRPWQPATSPPSRSASLT